MVADTLQIALPNLAFIVYDLEDNVLFAGIVA
jgi:hypothetical protein